jgi:putative transposase
MKPSRLTEEQITGILRRQEPGRRLPTLPQAWDQQSTFYEWQAKHGGLEVSDAKWLKVLEDENTKFKTIPPPKTCPEAVLPLARTGTLVSSPCRRSAART